MYKSILFKPLGIRLKWQVSNSNGSSSKSVRKEKEARGRRVDIRTFISGIPVCLGEIHVESVLDRYYLEGE